MKIAPSIPENLTADQMLNKILFNDNKALEQFTNCSIINLIRPLLYFKPIPITAYIERSKI
jgi:hypothetical protein